jgi:hypothetical protein
MAENEKKCFAEDCPCTNLSCKLHGLCVECVAVHRQNRNHLPECMADILRADVQALCAKVEFGVIDNMPAARRAREAAAAARK